MAAHLATYRTLPCLADRQKIIEQALSLLVEARAVAEHWDRSLALLSAEGPADGQTPPPDLS